jgi:hypothetical protein
MLFDDRVNAAKQILEKNSYLSISQQYNNKLLVKMENKTIYQNHAKIYFCID